MSLDNALRLAAVPGITDAVPSYRSLLLHYDPLLVDYDALVGSVEKIAETCVVADRPPERRIWQVPVVFGGEFGVDLDDIAKRAGISSTAFIIEICRPRYLVYMLGFSPGVAYLGGLDVRFETPRRIEPRLTSPGGTISLGGRQLAIHGLPGPCGWHLLGRTPTRSYNPKREPMFMFGASDEIEFCAIEASDWDRLDAAAASGEAVAKRIAT